MELIVRGENSKVLGRIGFDKKIHSVGKADPQLEAIIREVGRSGIPTLAEKTEEKKTSYYQTFVRADSPEALPALREYLAACGYEVESHHQETVDELTQELDAYEDCEEKQNLIKEIPGMDYLHQTALLEELKKKPRL